MSYQSYENLEVWRRSKASAVRVYRALKDCRDYGLRDQMQRAAVSVPSNIAEGYERHGVAEKRHFYSISKGSVAELRTQVMIAHEVGVISDAESTGLLGELAEISAMLHGLIQSLDRNGN